MRRLRERLGHGEAGLTLIEMLVAAGIGIIVLGATSSMLISSVRTQPKISERAEDVSTARWVMERMTREIRNGIAVKAAAPSTVSFTARVRHASCGSNAPLPASSSAIECKVTYSCGGGACTRSEAAPSSPGTGTPVRIFTGINNEKAFNYTPDENPTFIGITLRFPNPDGGGNFTVSDGATLRGTQPFG
jgi:Tfp pilus assembly protein PilW